MKSPRGEKNGSGACMKHGLPALAFVFALLGLAAGGGAADSAAAQDKPGSSQSVLRFLNETIDWYHRVEAIDPSLNGSQELLLRSNVRNNAQQATKLAFQFARGQAAILESQTAATAPVAAAHSTNGRTSGGTPSAHNLAAAADAADARVQQLQTQIAQLNAASQSASPTSRPALNAQRDRLAAQLNLATAQRDVLRQYAGFVTEEQSGDTASLSAKIDELQRAVPEVNVAAPTTSVSGSDADATAATAADPGILGSIREMFSLTQSMSELSRLTSQTQRLADENEKLRGPIRTQILDAIHRAQILSATTQPAGGDPTAMAAQRQQFDALTAQFKQLANIGVPLGEQRVVLDAAQQNLANWRSAVRRQYTRLMRDLLIQICFVVAIIVLIVVIASVWKHATFRYVHDPRRRRQLLLIRRIVVAALVVFVIAASVMSEFGSLATFAGLITAGIAVALQTVILSGVAYFFFIGRFGVRVGDRVTISGITGDVIEIGMFRLYLMELGGAKPDLHPTGRIVVFSNSVLFQPSAFYKQLPGAEYSWHEVSFTLSPETDYRLAEQRLMGAVKAVYAEYAQELRTQHESAVQELHVDMETPEPQGRLRFVEAGLELVVRYPVELQRASEIDDKITRKLLESINAEPKLKLVSAGTAKIQPS